MHSSNLLDSHPDGLGKHIRVYMGMQQNQEFTEIAIRECIADGGLPYFVEHQGILYYVEIGSDLVLEERMDFSTPQVVHDKLRSLDFYVDQIYAYLGITDGSTEYLTYLQ